MVAYIFSNYHNVLVNIYLLAALFSGIFYSVSTLIYKFANKHLIKDPLRYGFVSGLARVPFLLLLIPFLKMPTKLDAELILIVLLYSLVFFSANVLNVLAVSRLDVSVFAPLFNFQIIFTPLIAYFFLKERFSLIIYGLMAIIVAGSFFVTFSVHSQRRRGLIIGIVRRFINRSFSLPVPQEIPDKSAYWLAVAALTIGIIFYSLTDNLSGYIYRNWNVASLVFFSSFIQIFFSLFLIPFFGPTEDLKLKRIWPVFLHALFNFFGMIAINIGFSFSVSLTQAFSRLSTVYVLILVVLLSRFNRSLLEDNPPYVYAIRFSGSGVMVAAAMSIIYLK